MVHLVLSQTPRVGLAELASLALALAAGVGFCLGHLRAFTDFQEWTGLTPAMRLGTCMDAMM
jgi:hypothetical protein